MSDSPFLDKVKGKVKEVAGKVTGDDQLAHEGRLDQKHAAATQDAARLEEQAEQRQTEADLAEAKADNEAERARLQAKQEQAAREAQVEREQQAAEQQVEQQFEQREDAVERQAQAQQSAAARQQAEAARERAEKVADAAREEKLADAAETNAALIDTVRDARS